MSNQRKNKSNQTAIIAVAAVVVIAVLVLVGIKIFGGKSEENITTSELSMPSQVSKSMDENLNPLTGLSGFNESLINSRPLAVVISNAPAARPQWGLCAPDILVEGLVEGGMTRMMGLFSDVQNIPKIGPIRSARHDFLEFAQGFDAIFVHWGGSIYAYSAIEDSSRDVDHIDGMNGKYFHRDKERTSVGIEHRGYTTGEDIAKAIKDKSFRTEKKDNYKTLLSFNPENSPKSFNGGVCNSISFKFSGGYAHEFKYDGDKKTYFNNLNDKKMNDSKGIQMSATNVILLYCDVKSMGDSKGCVDMDLSSGSGVLASNGTYQDIKWEKGAYSDSLKLSFSDGSKVILNAGKSYVALVPSSESPSTVIA